MSENENEGYKIWLAKERQKDELLKLISMRGTIDVTQASDFLKKSLDDTNSLMEELEKKDLIQMKVGNYYQLTYRGYKRVRGTSEEQSSSEV